MKAVLADVDEDGLRATVNSLKAEGAEVIGFVTDVSKPDQVKTLAEKTIETFGGVHVLCNNAGVADNRPNSWDIPLEAWHWVLGVNLMGVIHGIKYFLPIMIAQDTKAHIVNTSSISGLINDFLNTPYGVSKHAIVALSENLHLELLMRGAKVNVSVLCPGPVNTNIHASIDRNRPKNVPVMEMPAESKRFIEANKIWLARGLDPMAVGRQVLTAIQKEQFYIVTDPDINTAIENRMTDILHRRNPVVPSPPQELVVIMEEMICCGGN